MSDDRPTQAEIREQLSKLEGPIREISRVGKAIMSTNLEDEIVYMLLHRFTKVPKTTIRKVIEGIEWLEWNCLKDAEKPE